MSQRSTEKVRSYIVFRIEELTQKVEFKEDPKTRKMYRVQQFKQKITGDVYFRDEYLGPFIKYK
jgi:hypothetical protein